MPGWGLGVDDDGRWHCVPVADLQEHYTEDCWCKPRVNEDGLTVHNAADRREEHENEVKH